MNVYNGFLILEHPDGPADLIGRNGADRVAMVISAHEEGEARARMLAQMPLTLALEDRTEIYAILTLFSGVEDE